MSVSIRTEYWYGIKFPAGDWELLEDMNKLRKENEEGEWKLDIPDLKWKYVSFKYPTYYDPFVEPLGIGVEIGSIEWGDVIAADEISFKLDPAVKEVTDKLLNELNIPGERKIYVSTCMC